MAKSSEMFLRVPHGHPGAPLAANKLLWKRRATVAGQMRGQKKSCFEAPVFYELLLPRPAPQPEPKKRREGGEGGREGGSRVGGWVGWWGEGGVGWGSVPLTCIPSWAEGHLHFFTSRTPPHHSKSLTGFFFWKALEDSENFLEVPRQPWWGPRYLFQ